MSWLPLSGIEWWIVATLATFRIASILHSERIARPFRKLFGVEELDDVHTGNTLTTYPDTFFGHLLECFWCVSIWASVGVFVVLLTPWYPLLLIPALSAGSILYRKWVD